ncbi:MAG: hypothetical protein K2N21_05135 [Rikenellaceae bacterium]|nr:hypothetical protein [Rikenellaceae bacterium]
MEFPAVGYRFTDGSLDSDVGAGGNYWSSVAYLSNYAYYLRFSSNGMTPQGNWSKQNGFSVRCVR